MSDTSTDASTPDTPTGEPQPTTIVKTVFEFTVLHRADEPIYELEHALRESWDGHAVGAVTSRRVANVADDKVPDELVELGNDGQFFDDDLAGDENSDELADGGTDTDPGQDTEPGQDTAAGR